MTPADWLLILIIGNFEFQSTRAFENQEQCLQVEQAFNEKGVIKAKCERYPYDRWRYLLAK